ncbi:MULTISPECIES: MFS transporter [Kitasatospora]|uniref:Putative major facilitator superfamily transporter n=1 Tax=Kitasatospora setae (strain ATCC 33774 / DSM 43861 / JCM 3304 / KCC A-0304 / NBRC 14216 / KM-6054) TaxID=452652 RepID=E4NES6_KITSK|nr:MULTISPECIES: MFS transporter [Kitasatospora]BAJ29862.1 putative major facilitator superfamily transporter [Kitasatospora setae KM-6054]
MSAARAVPPALDREVRTRSAARFAHPALLLAGIVLVALNMRACLAAVSPMVAEIQRTFGLSATASGLITTVPVLFQGVGAPLTPRLTRRFGTERVVLGAVLALGAGVLLRVLPSVAALYAGCVVIGVAIAVLNVSMPGLVKREFPHKAAMMTGVYSTTMLVGATMAAALSVPLERALGGGWRASLGAWSVLALVAAVAWLPQVLRARQERTAPVRVAGPVAPPKPVGSPWRSALAWQISVFMGVSSLLVYTLVAWMPTILADHGMPRGEAGLVFAFSNLVQVVGAFLVPLLAGRMTRQRGLALAMAGLNGAGVLWLLLAPVSGAWFSAAVLGLAQGGSLGLGLAFIVLRTDSVPGAARLGGMSQAVGYLVAAAGPVGAGALHQLTGGWDVTLVVLLALAAVAAVAGWGAGRDRTV